MTATTTSPNTAATTEWANPMGTDGFEFIEYAAPDPQAMGALFERMATYFDQADDKPYSHVILDDADVMGIDALRFAATLVADGGYGLTVTCTAEGGQLAKLLGLGHFAATRKLDQLPVLRST